MTRVARFEIGYTQFVDPAGKPVGPLPEFAQEPKALLPLYRGMMLTRRFDAKAIALQRTGRLGTYASSLGQEAVTVGVASAMRAEDVLLPSYRETGAQLWRGVSLLELLLYWGGDERGSDFKGPRADFPVAVPIASQCLHATGAAYAFKLRREPRVAVCVSGDGSTSNGAFYEAINTAGAWRVPAVFVINNNQWAISLPRASDGGRDFGAESDRRRDSRRPGRRQRRDRGPPSGRARDRARAWRRRAERGRGADLPDVRSHHGRRCVPLPGGWPGERAVGERPGRPAAPFPDRSRRLDQGRRGAAGRPAQSRDRRCGRALPGDAGTAARRQCSTICTPSCRGRSPASGWRS